MAIRVTKIAEVVEEHAVIEKRPVLGRKILKETTKIKHIMLTTNQKSQIDLLLNALESGAYNSTTIRPLYQDADPDSKWKYEVGISLGRVQQRTSAPMLPRQFDQNEPFFIRRSENFWPVVFFRNRLFLPERRPINEAERTEIALRVKKAVYDEEAELFGLREAVANMEAAVAFQKFGPKRDPIPEDVKLLVWARDGGSCVRCGSQQNLHFDHIIPVAKGGGNSDTNIQILCQLCNLKKSDKISFP